MTKEEEVEFQFTINPEKITRGVVYRNFKADALIELPVTLNGKEIGKIISVEKADTGYLLTAKIMKGHVTDFQRMIRETPSHVSVPYPHMKKERVRVDNPLGP